MHAKPLLLALALLTAPAWAARPFVTDDARLTTEGSCQLESWTRIYPDRRESWALPACNPGGNLEFTFGGGAARNFGASTTGDYILQLKTLFRRMETNGWGWGLAVGSIRHPQINPGPNQLGNTYAYVPISASMYDDRLIVHTNVGYLRDNASKRSSMTWGIGAEVPVSPHFMAIAEAFGDNHASPYWHAGMRFSIVPDRVQIDATTGRQFSGTRNDRWISFGLRLTPESLF